VPDMKLKIIFLQGLVNGFNGHQMQAGSSHHYPQAQQLQQHHHHQHEQQQQQPGSSWVTDQMMSQYAPTIEETDSPFYYEHNKLLFALHLERLQRNNQQGRPFS
jgi:hypothetical protein